MEAPESTTNINITNPTTGEQRVVKMTTRTTHALDGDEFLRTVQETFNFELNGHISEEIGGDDSGGMLVVDPQKDLNASDADRKSIEEILAGNGNTGNLTPKRFIELFFAVMTWGLDEPLAEYNLKFSW